MTVRGTEADESRPRFTPTRRQFLQFAAFGLAATTIAQRLPKAMAVADPNDGLAAFEGTLVSVDADLLTVQLATGKETVQATSSSQFWKGQLTGISAFSPGDDVLVRTLNGEIDMAWANLVRRKGTVVGHTTDSYQVELPSQSTLLVELADYTGYQGWITSSGAPPSTPLPNGTDVDVIGLETDYTDVVANLIFFALPSESSIARAGDQLPDTVSFDPITGATTHTYHGIISWYSCSTGAGRCARCDTSFDHQCAWPAWDSCGCCDSSCCDCSRNCKGQVRISTCGKDIDVTNACSGTTRTEHAVDCGPCQNCQCGCSTCVCSHTCKCPAKDISGTTTIVDLTKPSFALFLNPDNFGCFPGSASVTV